MYPPIQRLFAILVLLLAVSCQKETTSTTTTSSDTTIAAEPGTSPNTDGSGSTDPGPADSDGSSPSDNPVKNPPGGMPGTTPDPKPNPTQPSGNITIQSPQEGDYVNANGFVIRGLARTFENNVVYRVRDIATNKIIGQGFTTATGEMGQFSPYSATVAINKSGVQFPTRALVEVFENSAKDGSEINKVQVQVRMGVGADEPNAIEVFFSNAKKGSASNCNLVFSLPRSIPQTQALATIALQRLLAGPTSEERAQGYSSQIPAGTRLNKVSVASGVATADFSQELATAAGACRVQAIRAQIERTLKQFSTVKSVVITANGKRDVLEP